MDTQSDGDLSLILITNGFNIREFPFPIKPIYASIKDTFLSLNSITPIYLIYDKANQRFEIDKIENRYSSSNLATITDISDFKRTFSKDFYYNRILAGQKNKVDYEDINGIEEFNVKTEYSTR